MTKHHRSLANAKLPGLPKHAPSLPTMPLAPAEHPAQALWREFFAGNHQKVLEDADRRIPDTSEYLHISGLALVRLGKFEHGMARLKAASILPPPHPQRFSNAAIALTETQRLPDALRFSSEGVTLFPKDINLRFVHGNVLMAMEKWSDAAESYEAALAIDGTHLDSLLNLGNCYRRLNDLRRAENCYTRVLTGAPTRQDALINLTSLQLVEARSEDAKATLRICREGPPHAIADFMWSLMLLNEGTYIEGWDLYRRRHDTPMAQADRRLWTKPVPKTMDEAKGKKVLVLHEQGFGDSLQFVRYLPVIAKEASKTTMLVPQALKRLVDFSFPMVATALKREQADFELEIPLLDMPALSSTTLESIPDRIPYFSVPPMPERALPAREADRPVRIGLVWAGQSRPDPTLREIDGRRSTTLQTFAPLASVPGVQYVSLQLGEPSNQIGTVDLPMLTPLEPSFDFLDSAAVIKQLDLVIAVDTAVAHLSAGLGVETWILSRFDGCWRWLNNRSDSPWYPEVVRVFGQKAMGDWAGVMEEVVAALREKFPS